MYEDLAKRLRERAAWINFPHHGEEYPTEDAKLMMDAADAIEELNRDLDIAVRAEAAAVKACTPRWIPVTERLPENDGWYLVYAPDYRGGSSSGLKCVDGKMFCKFAKGKWSIEHGYYNRPGCVTHWMRLPEPPKEE